MEAIFASGPSSLLIQAQDWEILRAKRLYNIFICQYAELDALDDAFAQSNLELDELLNLRLEIHFSSVFAKSTPLDSQLLFVRDERKADQAPLPVLRLNSLERPNKVTAVSES